MSTDGVRFAHCVSEGWSLLLRGEESGQRLEPSLTRGEREAKAGAFAYTAMQVLLDQLYR
jgi:hypothetical protein